MHTRLKEIRKDAKKTQVEFAESLQMSRITITHAESGGYNLSDRAIREICRLYNIDENWFRTGEGQMHKPMTENQEIAEFLTRTMECDDEFKRRFIRALGRLDEDDWKLLAKIAQEMTKED